MQHLRSQISTNLAPFAQIPPFISSMIFQRRNESEESNLFETSFLFHNFYLLFAFLLTTIILVKEFYNNHTFGQKKQAKGDDQIDIQTNKSSINALAFPFYPHRKRSRYLSTLATISEEPQSFERTTHKINYPNYSTTQYDPIQSCRVKGNIHVSRKLTQDIIPNTVKHMQGISNMYMYLDKMTPFQITSTNTAQHVKQLQLKTDSIKALNYGFIDAHTNEPLYCLIKKQNPKRNRNYAWKMLDKLFTAKDIYTIYHISPNKLPQSCQLQQIFAAELNYSHLVNDILKSDHEEIKNIIHNTKWHRVQIFNRVNNTEKLSLHITKQHFQKQIKEFITNHRDNSVIPIIVFDNNNNYFMEYVQIIKISNICVGISYKYNNNANKIQVSGIHLHKGNILNQHELISPDHKCHCLDHFTTNITSLQIGNVNTKDNKIKDLKKRNNDLLSEKNKMYKENQILKHQLDALRKDKKTIKKENKNLKNTIANATIEAEKWKSLVHPTVSIQSLPLHSNETQNVVNSSIYFSFK